MAKMKRPSYREAIVYIALNIDPGDDDALNAEVVATYIPCALVAELFGIEPERVGKDVVKYREKIGNRKK